MGNKLPGRLWNPGTTGGVKRCQGAGRPAAAVAALQTQEQDRSAAGADCRAGHGVPVTADVRQLQLGDYGPFGLVFVDPPFAGPGCGDLCTLLEQSGALAADALIYLEMDKQHQLPEMPAGWRVLKEKTAGQVRFALVSN